LVLRRYQD
jgi:hypothetical protein